MIIKRGVVTRWRQIWSLMSSIVMTTMMLKMLMVTKKKRANNMKKWLDLLEVVLTLQVMRQPGKIIMQASQL